MNVETKTSSTLPDMPDDYSIYTSLGKATILGSHTTELVQCSSFTAMRSS